jgi:hypothetical protein
MVWLRTVPETLLGEQQGFIALLNFNAINQWRIITTQHGVC